jgi:hypothetical protein
MLNSSSLIGVSGESAYAYAHDNLHQTAAPIDSRCGALKRAVRLSLPLCVIMLKKVHVSRAA